MAIPALHAGDLENFGPLATQAYRASCRRVTEALLQQRALVLQLDEGQLRNLQALLDDGRWREATGSSPQSSTWWKCGCEIQRPPCSHGH